MKNILMLSYHFPPAINGGAFRPYSIYKYLPEYQIRPVIITNSCYGYLEDENNIYRFDALINWPNGGSAFKKILLKVIREFIIRAGLLQFWDFYWQKNTLKNIDAIIKRHDIRLIYATYPPGDTFKIGKHISQQYNLPLITEFRDGLAYEPLTQGSSFHHSLQKKFETESIKASSCIITIGETLSSYFLANYPNKPVHTVYNGYDPEDFEEQTNPETKNQNKIKIFHFGSISASRKRSAKPLFQSLAELAKQGRIKGDTFRLYLIGNHTKQEKQMAYDMSLNQIIKFFPPQDKKDGFSWIAKDADYLLFYGVEGQKSIVSSKLPEYLNLGKPIIGICKGNEAETIIQKTGTGEVCDFKAASITGIFLKCLNGNLRYEPRKEEIEKFNRVEQAWQIAEIASAYIT